MSESGFSCRTVGPAHRGFSLLEILIAVFLLVSSYAILITTFQGAGKEAPFTSEHFTAMFLAQKVLEDINGRIHENPHFFTELVHQAEGSESRVVGGESTFFRLLENTRNFNLLIPGEDDPIKEGDLYEQLKGFKLQVSTRMRPDPVTSEPMKNLVAVTVSVRWTSKEGIAKDYRITQLLNGTNDDLFKEPPNTDLTPAAQQELDRNAIVALARLLAPGDIKFANPEPGMFDLADIARASPDSNTQVLLPVGRMIFLLSESGDKDDKFAEEILPLEKKRDELRQFLGKSDKNAIDQEKCLEFVDLQKKIAELYQPKALNLLQPLLVLKKDLPTLRSAFSNPRLLGRELSLSINSIAGSLNIAMINTDVSLLAFSSAEKCFMSLLASPILESLPPRREPGIFRKVIDIQKIGILKESQAATREARLRDLKENLARFRKKFLGQHPFLIDFLEEETRICKSVPDLRENFKGITEVFDFLGGLPEEISRMNQAIPTEFQNR